MPVEIILWGNPVQLTLNSRVSEQNATHFKTSDHFTILPRLRYTVVRISSYEFCIRVYLGLKAVDLGPRSLRWQVRDIYISEHGRPLITRQNTGIGGG